MNKWERVCNFHANLWAWLKATFFLLGLTSCLSLAYIARYGPPARLMSLDMQLHEDKIKALQEVAQDYQDFKQIVGTKLMQADKVRMVKK